MSEHLKRIQLEVTMSVTVNVVRDGDVAILDCEQCGPLGVFDTKQVSEFVYNHLAVTHGCNMDHVDIRNHEEDT